MEVYTTIFMIFASHVLSSFSSRLRDGRHIPYPKIPIPIVHFQNHNNDEENQQDICLESKLPLTAGLLRGKNTNDDSNRNVQYDSDRVLKTKISDLQSRRGLRNLVSSNAFLPSFEINNPILHRKKKFSLTKNILNLFPGFINNKNSSTIRPLNSLKANNKADVTESGKSKNKIRSTYKSLPKARENKVKMKYTTNRPWNQLCQNGNNSENLKNECALTSTTCATSVTEDLCITVTSSSDPTKLKTTSDQCYKEIYKEKEDDQWLFNANPTNNLTQPETAGSSNPTDKCFTQSTLCRFKLRNSYLNKKKKKFLEDSRFKRRRKKRRNYFLASKSKLGILKSSLKKFEKITRKSRFVTEKLPAKLSESFLEIDKRKLIRLDINFFNDNLISRINKFNKRTLNGFRNENKPNLVGFNHFGACKKDRNITRGIPSCQKSCYYNLTNLVNARTIKPLEYFKKQPSLQLCCLGETNKSTSSRPSKSSLSNDLDDLEAAGGNTTVTVSSTSDILDTTGSVSETTVDSKISTPPLFKMVIQLRNMPTKKRSSSSRKPEGEFHVKLSVRNKKDFTVNYVKLKSELENESSGKSPILTAERRKQKKFHPWNASKYCFTCSVGKNKQTCCYDDNSKKSKLPWDVSCCYSSSSTNSTVKSLNTTSSWSKSTSTSDKSTKSIESEISSKGGEIASEDTEDNSIATEGPSSDTEAISIVTEATISATKAIISTVGVTTSIHDTTNSRPTAFNQQIKAKRSTFPHLKNTSTGEYTVENTLLRVPLNISPVMIQETPNFRATESRQPFGESRNNFERFKQVLEGVNISNVITVPVVVPEKYNQNGDLDLVLPPKYVKPRSIFREFLPSLLRKTTLPPLDHMWNIFDDKFSPGTTPLDIKKIYTQESPILNMNVNKRITKTCPSCLKKRKELVFETSYGNKKANCIIDDNNLLYEEETESDDSNSYESSTEECDGKYVSYLLKFPKESLIKSSSPASRESHLRKKGLTILHSHDSPPKYFIEVPESLAAVIELEDKARAKTLASTLQEENPDNPSQSQKQQIRGHGKKKVVLRLQPFGMNGHSLYLPMNGVDPYNSKASLFVGNTEAGDYLEHGLNPSRKPVLKGFIGKNDSVFPFALVPAFLAMRPSNLSGSATAEASYLPVTNQEELKSYLDATTKYSLTKDEEVALALLLNNLPIEKKPSKLSKHVKGIALKHPSSKVPFISVLPKKVNRKPTPAKPSVAPDRPTYIILIKDMANDPLLEDFEFPNDEIHSTYKTALSLHHWGDI